MCLIQRGKVLKINGDKAIVLINNKKKEITVKDKVRIGDKINVFQNLGYK